MASKTEIRQAMREALQRVHVVGDEIHFPATWVGYRDEGGHATTSTPIHTHGASPHYTGGAQAQRVQVAAGFVAGELGIEHFDARDCRTIADAVSAIVEEVAALEATSAAARVLGRKGGSVRSERKAAAVRQNGRLGGRRVCVHCGQPVIMRREAMKHIAQPHAGHRDPALNQTCGTWGWRWARKQVEE
jgi:hypothetical protein